MTTSAISTPVMSLRCADVRKSPVGQMPKICHQASGWLRFPSSLPLVNAPVWLNHMVAAERVGIARSAVATTRATAASTLDRRSGRRQRTTAAITAGTASHAAPAALCTPTVAAAATASGNTARRVGARRNAGSNAAINTSRAASASSLIPPHSA